MIISNKTELKYFVYLNYSFYFQKENIEKFEL